MTGDRAAHRGIGSLDQVGSLEASASAYTTRMSPLAFFSHVTAARLWGIALPQRLSHGRLLDLEVRSGNYPPAAKNVRGHREQVAARDVVEWWPDGMHTGGGEHPCGSLRVTSLARTLCEISSVLSERELVVAGDFLRWWRRHPHLRLVRLDLEDALGRFTGRLRVPAGGSGDCVSE